MAGELLAAATTASGPSPWWFILPPIAGVLIAALGVYIAVNKDRRDNHRVEDDRNERLDHCADAVLGIEADPAKGRMKVQGLIERFGEYEKVQREILTTIGKVNGSGKTVMQHFAEINEGIGRLGGAQLDLAQGQEQHALEDERRFGDLDKAIQSLSRKVGHSTS